MDQQPSSPGTSRSSSEPSAPPDDGERIAARSEDDVRAHVALQLRSVYRWGTAIAAAIGRATGIHATDVDALRLLDMTSRRPTMSELGTQLGLSSAAVTALVDRLEEAGLARRVRDVDDRRRIHVEPTESARQFASEQLQPLGRTIQRAIAATPFDDLVAVERFLAELLAPDGDPPTT
jgi:DNA-binding MarR family transcriptional regulator